MSTRLNSKRRPTTSSTAAPPISVVLVSWKTEELLIRLWRYALWSTLVGISKYGENSFPGQASHAICQWQETGCWARDWAGRPIPANQVLKQHAGMIKAQGFTKNPKLWRICPQVTESIPKSIFDKANRLRKTCYLKAIQVPRVGGKQV